MRRPFFSSRRKTGPTLASKRQELSEQENISRVSGHDSICYHAMVGFSETWFVAFGLALGLSEREGTLLAVAPILVASALQLILRPLLCRFRSPRRAVVFLAGLQAASLLLAMTAVFQTADPRPALFAMVSLYWLGGLSAGPLWNVWIGRIVPYRQQKAFFFRRSRKGYLALLISLVLAGFGLQALQGDPWLVKMGFLFFILLGGLMRAFSTWFLSRHPDAHEGATEVCSPAQTEPDHVRPLEGPAVPVMTSGGRSWLFRAPVLYCLSFYFLLNFSVHAASPLFTPFMLKELKLDYKTFLLLILAPLFIRPYVGNLFRSLSDRFGVQMMFALGVLLISPLPFLWTVSHHVVWLFCAQLLSGLAWGAQELGMTLYLLENVPERERSRLLSWNQLLSATGMALGLSFALMNFPDGELKQEDYHQAFFLSSFLRLLPLLLVPFLIRSLRPGDVLPGRILSVRAGAQGFLRPLLLYRYNRSLRRRGVRTDPP